MKIKKNRIVKIGVVGSGNAAFEHIKTIKNIDCLKVTSVSSSNKQRLNNISHKYQLNKYNSINSMIDHEDLDFILIANENYLHYKNAKIAIKAGLNVVIEKPIDSNFRNFQHLLNLSEKYKKKIYVVLQKRFDHANNFLQNLIKRKIFGKLIYVKVDILMHRKLDYFRSRKWIQDPIKVGGGIMIHQGIHLFDQILFILDDEITKYSSWSSNNIKKLKYEDTFGSWITFKKGFGLTINATVNASEYLKNKIEFVFEKNNIIYEDGIIFTYTNNKKKIIKKFLNNYRGTYNNVWTNIYKTYNSKKKDSPILINNTIDNHKLIYKMYQKAFKNNV